MSHLLPFQLLPMQIIPNNQDVYSPYTLWCCCKIVEGTMEWIVLATNHMKQSIFEVAGHDPYAIFIFLFI